MNLTSLLVGMAEAYGQPMSKERLSIYSKMLEDIDLQTLQARIGTWMRTQQRFPTIADLRAETNQSTEELALAALAVVEANNSPSRSYVFSDPVIHSLAEHYGGWPRLCEIVGRTPDKEYSFWRRDWIACYRAFRVRGEHPPRAMGEIEAHNSQLPGYEKSYPLLTVACPYIDNQKALNA